MRVPIGLLILTIIALLMAAISARAGGGRIRTMTDIVFDEPVPMFGKDDPKEAQEHGFIHTDISVTVDLNDLWKADEENTPLWVRFVRGVLRSREMDKVNGTTYIRWERCGERVPEEDMHVLATEWAVSILASLKEVENQTGIKINPWGAFATTANEGGFNECTLDYQSRKWATNNGLVEKFRLTYDKETVWNIIKSKKWKKRPHKKRRADFGPYQMRFPVKKISRDRFDKLLSIHPGVYLGIREMARRAKNYKHRHHLNSVHPRPWMMWPGCMVSIDRRYKYDRKITTVARWLGATREEI